MDLPALDLDEGLRARKQRETRHRIARTGFELFLDKGFDATTLDEIAAAAGVARRTLFNYFPAKEDILLAWEADLDEAARAAVAARPDGETPLEMVRAALLDLTGSFESDRARAIDTLMYATETLRARKQAGWERKERILAESLATRWPDPAMATTLRITAALGIAALRLSIDRWRADAVPREIGDYLRESMDIMRKGFT